jgi:hypothetical protein
MSLACLLKMYLGWSWPVCHTYSTCSPARSAVPCCSGYFHLPLEYTILYELLSHCGMVRGMVCGACVKRRWHGAWACSRCAQVSSCKPSTNVSFPLSFASTNVFLSSQSSDERFLSDPYGAGMVDAEANAYNTVLTSQTVHLRGTVETKASRSGAQMSI